MKEAMNIYKNKLNASKIFFWYEFGISTCDCRD